ncbi:MAG: MipA/OmpV family protein [Desulfobacteraceae bacterium]|jgi:outer membrane scaffolding protein for murein synthesis (MipA/OmpV family)
MKQQYVSVNYKICLWIIFFLLSGILFSSWPVEAQQAPERNWYLWMGGGCLTEPVYPGSDALYVIPFPFIQAEYHLESFDVFASVIDGFGVQYKNTEFAGLSLSLSIDPLGNKRDPELKDVKHFMLTDVDDLKDFLKDTPTIDNKVDVSGTLQIDLLPFASLSSTVSYFPTKADNATYPDKKYDGITASFDLQSDYQLAPNMFLQGGVGITWMNDDYAEAFHSVLYSTSALEQFAAENGISDVHGCLTFIHFFTEHYGLIVYGSGTLLLGNSAHSPLTKNTFQPEMRLMVFYDF